MGGAPAPAPLNTGSCRLRYKDASPIRVRGPRTGREYRFSAADPEQSVSRQDAEALLGTGLFQRLS